MPAQIGHQVMQRIIFIFAQKARQRIIAGHIGCNLFAPCRPALKCQRRIDVIWRVIEPFFQGLTARLGKGLMQFSAILNRDHVPADRPEEPANDAKQMGINHAIKALAVIINHPPNIADVMLPRIQKRLIDIAFIKFRIANQCDHAAWHFVLGQHVFVAQVILRKRGKVRHRSTKPDRTGREINLIAILGPRWIGLRPAKRTEFFEFFLGLTAKQIIDRMENRAGMRFDRDPILRAQNIEIKGCHQGCHRRTAGLMPTDLDTIALGAQMVGIMDGPA